MGASGVTCLAVECLTYFFSSRRLPDDDLFSFPRRYSLSERRVMAKGCGFIFLSNKKRTKSFSTPYNAYNIYIYNLYIGILPYRVNILLSISPWATASLDIASIWHESTYFHSPQPNTSFTYKFLLLFSIYYIIHYIILLYFWVVLYYYYYYTF